MITVTAVAMQKKKLSTVERSFFVGKKKDKKIDVLYNLYLW